MRRLKEELESELKRVTKQDHEDATKKKDSNKPADNQEVRDLIRELRAVMEKISQAALRAFVIIDALNKVAHSGQIMKVCVD